MDYPELISCEINFDTESYIGDIPGGGFSYSGLIDQLSIYTETLSTFRIH